MRNLIIAALLLPVAAFSQYKLSNSYLNYDKQTSYTYENLRLYPIIARDSFKLAFKNVSKFTPLKQALEQKKVLITEQGSGGTVNTLTIENKSKDTIIINCGEVIKGGQQDRVINTDLVLYPGSGKKDLSVFCVEHGRWSTRSQSAGYRSSGSNLEARSFDGYFNFSSQGLRKVVTKDSDQVKVWNKVKEINAMNKTENSTGTYTALDQSKDYNAKINKYISSLQPKINALKDIVGVIVVSGDKVLGTDIFATHDLFIQNFEGLLHSYATEAILNGKPVTITQPAVDKYVTDLLSDEKKQNETLKNKGSKFVNKGDKLRISVFE